MKNGGIMISQCFPKSRNHDGETLKVGQYVFEEAGYTQIQMVDILDDSERAAFGEVALRNNARITYCIARLLNDHKLYLCDLDDEKRKAAIELVKSQFAKAREVGAEAITLISGPRPESEEARKAALAVLTEAMIEVAAYGRQVAPEITLRIEPLDVSAHKKNTLGSTQEAIALCEAAERAGERVRLCFDTAHAILNGEDMEESIAAAGKWIEEFHLCNACITPGHALYGDRHIAPGEPGAFDIAQYQKFIAAAKVHCPDARVFTEYMCPDGMSGEEMVALHAQIVSESNVMVRRK